MYTMNPKFMFYFLVFPFIVLLVVSFVGFVVWVLIGLIFGYKKSPLIEEDKLVKHINFNKGSRDCIGNLEIVDNVLLFKSKEPDKETLKIPLKQISGIKTYPAVYSFWATWIHYFWVIYKPDNISQEERVGFMFQRNAGIYAEEIKSKIESLIKND